MLSEAPASVESARDAISSALILLPVTEVASQENECQRGELTRTVLDSNVPAASEMISVWPSGVIAMPRGDRSLPFVPIPS